MDGYFTAFSSIETLFFIPPRSFENRLKDNVSIELKPVN